MNKQWKLGFFAPLALLGLLTCSAFATAEDGVRIDPRNQAFEEAHPDQYHSWKATSESKK